MDRSRDKWRTCLICFFLAVAVAALYGPLFHHEFIIYDDGQYIVDNPHVTGGLTWANVVWAFGSTHASNWHPLTWVSHMLDVQLFGLRPGWHHIVSLALHIANSLLLLLLLKRITGAFWRSAIVAALFALHPAHVESVAWAAERKDVLSTFFFLLTLGAYTRFAEALRSKSEGRGPKADRTPNPELRTPTSQHPVSSLQYPASGDRASSFIIHNSSFRWYCLSLFFFALGLMCKPMLVTVPFVLLLLDYWPLRRLRRSAFTLLPSLHHSAAPELRLVLEKLPFFALSAASSVITVVAQHSGGSMETLQRVPLDSRLGNALVAYWSYLQKLVWPGGLAIIYQRPDTWPMEQVGLAALALAFITALLVWLAFRDDRPYLAVGWLWYIGTLVPVVGLVQVGNQFMADRYTYIPFIGCFIAGVWGARDLAERYRLGPSIIVPVSLLLLAAFGVATGQQVHTWKNSETVFVHCIVVTGDNAIAHNNLGAALAQRGKLQEARGHIEAALRIRPGDADALHNLGIVLLSEGHFDEARSRLQEAAGIKHELIPDYAKLGLIMDGEGKTETAIACYREHLHARPDDAEVCNNLAWVLATYPDARLRDGKEAVRLAEHACVLTSYRKTVLVGTLAAAYAEAGRFQDAVATAGKAIALAADAGHGALAERNRQLLELYRAGKPYHESAINPGH